MADIDEDSALRAEPDITDVDFSDEVQDFQFLSSLSQQAASPLIPQRGTDS